MSAVTRPRGPLPRRVYWTRRLLVLLVAGGLVVLLAHLLGGGGPGRRSATPVSGTTTAEPTSPQPSQTTAVPTTRGVDGGDGPHTRGGDAKRGLPQPDGPCDDADVLVTPSLPDPHAGEPVDIKLELTTTKSAACTWEVSPDTVFLTIDSQSGRIWSSQECPSAIPTQDVVPRRKKAAVVHLSWNAKASDPGCTAATDWVLPGVYTATAVARGSVTPIDVGFLLGPAQAPTITKTPTPTPTSTPSEPTSGTAAGTGSAAGSASGSAAPTGAASPTASPS